MKCKWNVFRRMKNNKDADNLVLDENRRKDKGKDNSNFRSRKRKRKKEFSISNGYQTTARCFQLSRGGGSFRYSRAAFAVPSPKKGPPEFASLSH